MDAADKMHKKTNKVQSMSLITDLCMNCLSGAHYLTIVKLCRDFLCPWPTLVALVAITQQLTVERAREALIVIVTRQKNQASQSTAVLLSANDHYPENQGEQKTIEQAHRDEVEHKSTQEIGSTTFQTAPLINRLIDSPPQFTCTQQCLSLLQSLIYGTVNGKSMFVLSNFSFTVCVLVQAVSSQSPTAIRLAFTFKRAVKTVVCTRCVLLKCAQHDTQSEHTPNTHTNTHSN